jgi:HSP20 family protein
MYYSCAPFEQIRKVHFIPHMMDRVRENLRVSIPMEVVDGKDSYTIKAVLPGLTSDEVSIETKDDLLSITAEVKDEADESKVYLLKEIPSGKYQRTIRLPSVVDPEKATASMENGILKIEIPKAEKAKPRTVKINK